MTLCSYTKAEQGRAQTQRGRRYSEFLFYTLKNLVINAKAVGSGERQWWEHGGENDGDRSLITTGNLVRLLVEQRQTPVDESPPSISSMVCGSGGGEVSACRWFGMDGFVTRSWVFSDLDSFIDGRAVPLEQSISLV